MKTEVVAFYVRTDQLRPRQQDTEKVKSMLHSAEINAAVVKSLDLNEKSATVIFRELYESIRQLGDAKWWLSGYEPRNHEVSIAILEGMDIKNKLALYHLSRFKKIRNDANYRGFRVSVMQAKELVDFWNTSGTEILQQLLKEL